MFQSYLLGLVSLYNALSLLFIVDLQFSCSSTIAESRVIMLMRCYKILYCYYCYIIVLYCYYWIVYFSLHFCHLLLHIFWCFVIRCIYAYNCYMFLMDWLIYHYEMFFFISRNFFALKSLLSDSITTPPFLWFLFTRFIFFHPFTFHLFVSLSLKW